VSYEGGEKLTPSNDAQGLPWQRVAQLDRFTGGLLCGLGSDYVRLIGFIRRSNGAFHI